MLPGEVMHDGEYTDGERRVLEQVAQLARALRADRDRLTRRLAEVGAELNVLAWTLDGQPALVTLASRRACHLTPKISSNRRTARSQTNAVVTNRMPAAASRPRSGSFTTTRSSLAARSATSRRRATRAVSPSRA